MKTLKTELKQHFVSAYVNQHLSDRAGYPEESNIDNLILAAEALFDKYLDEPFGKNWDYDALKKVLVYTRDFPTPHIGADWGNPQHAADALAYCIKAHFPSIEFPKGGEAPKAKVFNGSDFPNDENNRYFWEIKESKLTHGSIDSNDLFDKKFNWPDQFGDTAKKLSVIRWFEAQGTPKHLSIAKRLREIACIIGEIHDEIIIEL